MEHLQSHHAYLNVPVRCYESTREGTDAGRCQAADKRVLQNVY
jgi:hypothetical protein